MIGMRFALVDLDKGVFMEKDGWTADVKLATTFPDLETVSGIAEANKMGHVAAAMVDSNPLQLRGFLWLRESAPPSRL